MNGTCESKVNVQPIMCPTRKILRIPSGHPTRSVRPFKGKRIKRGKLREKILSQGSMVNSIGPSVMSGSLIEQVSLIIYFKSVLNIQFFKTNHFIAIFYSAVAEW